MKYQTHASPMITPTTTRLITVSWNIAYGKNGFPVALDVLLVALVLARGARSIRGYSPSEPPRPAGPDEALSAARWRRRLVALAPGGVVRPRRRGDAEADDEIEVQADQREDRARDHEHVQRVELAQRVGADLGAARIRTAPGRGRRTGAVPFRLIPTTVAQ